MLDLEITAKHRLKQPLLTHTVSYSVDSTTNYNNRNNTIYHSELKKQITEVATF